PRGFSCSMISAAVIGISLPRAGRPPIVDGGACPINSGEYRNQRGLQVNSGASAGTPPAPLIWCSGRSCAGLRGQIPGDGADQSFAGESYLGKNQIEQFRAQKSSGW